MNILISKHALSPFLARSNESMVTSNHDQATRHLAARLYLKKDFRTAFDMVEDLVSRSSDRVGIQILAARSGCGAPARRRSGNLFGMNDNDERDGKKKNATHHVNSAVKDIRN